MAWVEKNHNDHRVLTPCYVQGHQPPDQAALSHIQPGLECLQGWGIHSLLGQPIQCVTTLWVKNFFLISNLNLPKWVGMTATHVPRWSGIVLRACWAGCCPRRSLQSPEIGS